METRTEEIFLKKAELLLEIIEVVGDQHVEQASILVTRSGEISTSESEWCGFMSELKKNLFGYGKSISSLIERQT